MAEMVAIEPTKDKEILSITTSKERNMFIATFSIKSNKKEHGKH